MLTQFSQDLTQKFLHDQSVRPFVCDGNPFDCQIFIVGINPATQMDTGFLEFWSDSVGFDETSWLQQYVTERKNKPLKKGRKRRQTFSSTRTRIEWLCSALKPDKILETNLYAKATPIAAELLQDDRKIDLFNFLVNTIKPKILFLHGKETKEDVERLLSVDLVENEFVECNISNDMVKVLFMKHLSRGWSREATLQLADRLRRELHN